MKANTFLKILDLAQLNKLEGARIKLMRLRVNEWTAGGEEPTDEEWESLLDTHQQSADVLFEPTPEPGELPADPAAG